MDPVMDWLMEDRGRRIVEELKKREFNAIFVKNQAQAKEILLKEVPPGAVVGAGGSMTIRELKVLDELKARGHKILDHWAAASLPPAELYQLRRGQQHSDVFLTSTNAITADGLLVNTDGGGNRVMSMGFGPKKLIMVAGVNKIVPDLDSAFRRIKEFVVPLNCKRMNMSPPCMKAGKCVDCRVSQRVCRVTTILEFRPAFFDDYIIIVVGENLGY